MIKPRQTKAIALMLLCTIFASTAHILFKFGANKIDSTNYLSYINLYLILGMTGFALGAVLMMAAFRMGELAVLFPLLATGYIWVSLSSPIFFATDSMNIWKWLGIIIILVSVSILGFGSANGWGAGK